MTMGILWLYLVHKTNTAFEGEIDVVDVIFLGTLGSVLSLLSKKWLTQERILIGSQINDLTSEMI